MDQALREKLEEKIQDVTSRKNEIKDLTEVLSMDAGPKSFMVGVLVGRLYNAFYYQTKRMFNREPTQSEFQEFVILIRSKKLEMLW